MPRRTAWIIGLIVAASLIGGLTYFAVQQNKSERGISQNRLAVYRALVENRKSDRRICRAFNVFKRNVRITVLEPTRPSATKTEYFATHPKEYAAALKQFEATLRVFSSRNCLKVYPVPKLKDFLKGGDSPTTGNTNSRPP